MINDTKINARQKHILKEIIKNGFVSRAQIDSIGSRITAIRDLNALIQAKLVRVQGMGRATKYVLAEINPRLYYVDPTDYFANDLDARGAKTYFNQKIFKQLGRLFSPEEVYDLKQKATGFSQRGRKLNPTIFKRELERLVIEFSWKSSQIEGNTYDLLETETLIKQRIEAKGRSKEEAIMILNHKAAFDSILNNRASFKTLSFADVNQLHGLLTKDLGIDAAIRSQPVAITGTLYH